MKANKYQEGIAAANTDGVSINDNPYKAGTVAYEAWAQGFADGLDDETENENEQTTELEGADIMEVY